jgi:hypothetical protein
MSLVYAEDKNELVIKFITEIVKNIKLNEPKILKNIKYKESQELYFYMSSSFGISLSATIPLIQYNIYSDVLISLDIVKTGTAKSYGLCAPLCTFLLLKIYNFAIQKYGSKINKFRGSVIVMSSEPERAKICYNTAYRMLGFFDDVNRTQGGQLYFEKIKPIGGWKEINKTYTYYYPRLNIKYIIDKDKISVVKN